MLEDIVGSGPVRVREFPGLPVTHDIPPRQIWATLPTKLMHTGKYFRSAVLGGSIAPAPLEGGFPCADRVLRNRGNGWDEDAK